jgi:hypothetical protein
LKQESCGDEPIEVEIDFTDDNHGNVIHDMLSLVLSTHIIDTNPNQQSAFREKKRDFSFNDPSSSAGSNEHYDMLETNHISDMDDLKTNTGIVPILFSVIFTHLFLFKMLLKLILIRRVLLY